MSTGNQQIELTTEQVDFILQWAQSMGLILVQGVRAILQQLADQSNQRGVQNRARNVESMQANETARQQDEEQFAGQLVQVGRNANAFGVDFQNQLLNMNVFDSMLVHMATEAPARAPAPATPSRSFSSAAVAPSPAGRYQAAPSPSHVGFQPTGATFVQNRRVIAVRNMAKGSI